MDRHKAITNNKMTKLKAQDKAGINAMREIGDRSSSFSSIDPLDAEAIRVEGVIEETEEEKEARLLKASDTKAAIRMSFKRSSLLVLDDEDKPKWKPPSFKEAREEWKTKHWRNGSTDIDADTRKIRRGFMSLPSLKEAESYTE